MRIALASRAWIWSNAWKPTRRIPGSLQKACSWLLPPYAPGSCPERFMLNPLFPGQLMLHSCVRMSVLSGGMVASFLPIIIGDILLLPNQMRLLLAGERKHPENIVQRDEKATTDLEYINIFKSIPCHGRILARTKRFQNIKCIEKFT